MTNREIISNIYQELKNIVQEYARTKYGVMNKDFDYCRKKIGTPETYSLVDNIKYDEVYEQAPNELKEAMSERYFNSAKQIMLSHLVDLISIESNY